MHGLNKVATLIQSKFFYRKMTGHLRRGLLKFRWFHSKGAALVLVWALLTIAGNRVSYEVVASLISLPFTSLSTGAFVFATVPFFGWLADAKLGNYKVVKIGITISWLASVLVSIFTLLYYNTSLSSDQNVAVGTALLVVISILQWTGSVIIILNSLQLSLEQMPDASAENITSLIAWFVFSLVAGVWVGDTVKDLVLTCVPYNKADLYQVLTLFPVICASINFSLLHLISPKRLIIEPKSPQSLKNIYRVLKFAAKHKAPINRSALTYWEEDIPSRLDLGKSRYGGPFTTEQVEDVKTFFRILAVSVGIFLPCFAWEVNGHTVYDTVSTGIFNTTIARLDLCKVNGQYLFTLHPLWCATLMVLVNELLIYPCFKHRLPNSMKRMGMASFVVVLRNIMFLILSILEHFNIVEREAPWMLGINSVLGGVLMAFSVTACFEFICAQSPYNMRGLMSGYIQLVVWLAFFIGNVFNYEFVHYCLTPGCSLANASVGAAVSIFAFLVYLIIARWYKRRVRDDIDTPHKWVEDVYDRYLSAAVNN